MDIAKAVGLRIKKGRNTLGLSVSQFSSRIGRHPAEISKMESGDMDLKLSELDKIFEAAEIEFDALTVEVKTSEEPKPKKDLTPTLRDLLSIVASLERQIFEMRNKLTADLEDDDSPDSQRDQALPVRSVSDRSGPENFRPGNTTPI